MFRVMGRTPLLVGIFNVVDDLVILQRKRRSMQTTNGSELVFPVVNLTGK